MQSHHNKISYPRAKDMPRARSSWNAKFHHSCAISTRLLKTPELERTAVCFLLLCSCSPWFLFRAPSFSFNFVHFRDFRSSCAIIVAPASAVEMWKRRRRVLLLKKSSECRLFQRRRKNNDGSERESEREREERERESEERRTKIGIGVFDELRKTTHWGLFSAAAATSHSFASHGVNCSTQVS